MPTERFSREEFEVALPKLARHIGLAGGEHCYVIPVVHPTKPKFEPEVEIYIRSSIDASGFAADTGADSIRVTLVDAIDRKPLATKAAKPQRWVARTANWRVNLMKLLRWNFKVGCLLGTCPACKRGETMLHRVNNPSKTSNGALYVSCLARCGRYFVWINEETGEPAPEAMPPTKEPKSDIKRKTRKRRRTVGSEDEHVIESHQL